MEQSPPSLSLRGPLPHHLRSSPVRPADRAPGAASLESSDNTTQGHPPRGVHDLFSAQAARTPDAIALEFGEVRLSYRELEAQANRLAHPLQRLGVGPDRRVGIFMDRSIEFVVSILATLKAGGCYVPLDPSYPADRLQMMLDEAEATVLLTQPSLSDELSRPEGCSTLLPDLSATLDDVPATPPLARNTPSSLAYVLFTSGSTGRPKGVAMPHGPLIDLIEWQCGRSSLGVGDRTLQFSALSFDVSFQELFATWGSGGTLVLISEETRRDAVALLRMVEEKAVRRLFLPFVALQHITEMAVAKNLYPTSLREVITAGEQLKTVPSLQAFFRTLPDCSLENQYGPTESHVVTAYRLPADVDTWALLPSIGRPIPSAQIYLLDEALRPVPQGDTGELYIGGDCLAREYLHRPDETAARFRPDPFRDTADARMYRTGDLARAASDGTLEFLGRADHQVKVRGYRVELGEIEAVLNEHDSVREAVVVPDRGGEQGTQTLVAALILQPGASLDRSALRAALATRLPDYMIPSVFETVTTFPLTPSGKVDRKALSSLPRTAVPDRTDAVAPRDDLERFLVQLWKESLGLPEVGIRDDFFALGGHSIKAAEMLVSVSGHLGRELPLSLLADTPTIEALADKLRRSADRAGWSPLVPIRTEGSAPPLFCVHGGGLQVLGFRLLAEQLDPAQPVYGLQWAGLDGRPMPSTLTEIADLYLDEIRSVHPEGPYLLAGHCYGAMVCYEMAQRLRGAGETVELLVMIDPPEIGAAAVPPASFRRSLWRIIRDTWRTPSLLIQKIRVLLGLRTRFDIVRSLISGRSVSESTRKQSTWKPGITELYRLFGTNIPQEARGFYAVQRMNKALVRYRPRPYDGRTLVFHTQAAPSFDLEALASPTDATTAHAHHSVRVETGHDEIVYHAETARRLRSDLAAARRRIGDENVHA